MKWQQHQNRKSTIHCIYAYFTSKTHYQQDITEATSSVRNIDFFFVWQLLGSRGVLPPDTFDMSQ